jgi:hypothetical protein
MEKVTLLKGIIEDAYMSRTGYEETYIIQIRYPAEGDLGEQWAQFSVPTGREQDPNDEELLGPENRRSELIGKEFSISITEPGS